MIAFCFIMSLSLSSSVSPSVINRIFDCVTLQHTITNDIELLFLPYIPVSPTCGLDDGAYIHFSSYNTRPHVYQVKHWKGLKNCEMLLPWTVQKHEPFLTFIPNCFANRVPSVDHVVGEITLQVHVPSEYFNGQKIFDDEFSERFKTYLGRGNAINKDQKYTLLFQSQLFHNISVMKLKNQRDESVDVAIFDPDQPVQIFYEILGPHKNRFVLRSRANKPITSDDFFKLGIGGQKKQIETIIKQAFQSRQLTAEECEHNGIKHVRGVILHGPPGNGKTLIARQLGELLQCKSIQVVQGPEIVSKWLGESEKHMRELFTNAIEDAKENGKDAGLHLIVFDEFDAIGRRRGTSTQEHMDRVVNQLLAYMDGIHQLENVLVFALTNAIDVIDDALRRPGRFEIDIKIDLPDEAGRLEILEIHTRNTHCDDSVNLAHIARDAVNFTGAELLGLVNCARSFAVTRHLSRKKDDFSSFGSTIEKHADGKSLSKIPVTEEDFRQAFESVTPKLGSDDAKFLHELVDAFAWTTGKSSNPSECFKEMITNQNMVDLGQVAAGQKLDRMPIFVNYTPALVAKAALEYAKATNCVFIKFVKTEDFLLAVDQVEFLTRIFEDASHPPRALIVFENLDAIVNLFEGEYNKRSAQIFFALARQHSDKNRNITLIGSASQTFKSLFQFRPEVKFC